MPVFIVSFRGVALVVLVIFCFGVAHKTTVVVLVLLLVVKLAFWLLRTGDRIADWKYRWNNFL